MTSSYADFQYEIYLANDRCDLPFNMSELEERARRVISPQCYSYVASGAATEETMQANAESFRRWRIVPRMLRDVSSRDLSVELFGTWFPAPVLLSPVGVQSIVHPDGEVASAKAAASLGIPFVLSSVASVNIEDVAVAMGDSPRWFQLYWPKDPELTRSFLGRAEDSGYSAIVVTLDNALVGWRTRDLALKYLPFLLGPMANYFSDPVFRAGLAVPPEEDLDAAILHFAAVFADMALTWADLAVLRKMTRLPLLVKGITHPDDARAAIDNGADGIVVSNHGGRQVDGAIAALDALPDVIKAVAGQTPVLFDSGIRSGSDAFKALALGARAVLLGRPYLWGLALAGERGVRHVLRSFLADLDLTFALSGCSALADCGANALRRV
ncbi:MAG TPA: lactate 2-monooxygenase [Streptosporangiaceae bacterium]|nr:lactate 2-monooxygenase [Streptosporangiaceae bacterium]